MPEADELITQAEKLKALRQIQFQLGQIKHPLARSCGLTEAMFRVLVSEQLIRAGDCQDGPTILDTHRIYKILPEGHAILSLAHVADPEPLKVIDATPPKSIWIRIFEGTRSGLWDLIKVALGAIAGGLVTLYLTHHPK
ncbi:MAG TPA: hypothetical protein VFC17_11885 [Candidatus Limnocylindrales bacterium]|nr:hypothetical protein [Candidatus Limnocylindrales bacterium]